MSSSYVKSLLLGESELSALTDDSFLFVVVFDCLVNFEYKSKNGTDSGEKRDRMHIFTSSIGLQRGGIGFPHLGY